MERIILCLIIGLCAGTISGFVGIGGGVIIVPALILLFGFTQHQAQGTTLALLVPPIGFLAAYAYFQKGFVNIKVALFICIGFFIGGLIGPKIAINIPKDILQKVFGATIMLLGMYMFIKK
jgi:uncharacterized membrane protein YfcA